jgi:hypothetical protein
MMNKIPGGSATGKPVCQQGWPKGQPDGHKVGKGIQMSNWISESLRKIEVDSQRSADTHLFKLSIPRLKHVDIYLKDESTHPTGSLKHRLTRSLFLYALRRSTFEPGIPLVLPPRFD